MLICKVEKDVVVEREVVVKTMCDICNKEWHADMSGYTISFDNRFLIGNDPYGELNIFHVCRICMFGKVATFLSATGLPISVKEESGGRTLELLGNRKQIVRDKSEEDDQDLEEDSE